MSNPELATIAWPDGTTALMRLPGDEATALEIAQLLLAAGADPARRNSKGLSAADLAASREMLRVAGLLRGHP
jgi:ankyrin repeat protein